jgi:alpha-beta hydrolase superfamily lysophospholipase
MLEFRGHGDSPENNMYTKNCLELYAQYDLPAVQAFITEQTQQKTIWLGHSSGGVCIATAVAGKHIAAEDVLAVALFGAQVSHYPLMMYIPFARTCSHLWLLTKKRIINTKLGPEIEPRGIALEFIRWSGLFSRWKSKQGLSYWKALKDIDLPVIAFAAKKDKGDPAKCCEKLLNAFSGLKQYHLLAKSKGFSMDYTHGNMVKSDSAEKEVWPLLIDWLKKLDK